MQKVNAEHIELLSVHIPKTAGTSFRNILKSVYGNDAVARLDLHHKPNGAIRFKLNESEFQGQSLDPTIRVLHGHFKYSLLKERFEFSDNVKLVTWVREPVNRVISNFYYLKKMLRKYLGNSMDKEVILRRNERTLIQYSACDIARNVQSSFISEVGLENFDFIGFHEHFKKDLQLLATMFQWNQFDFKEDNVTGEKKIDHDHNTIERIKVLNEKDVELYERLKSNRK